MDGTNLSKDFKDLIVSLLAFDPRERPTIAEIRQSSFLRDGRFNAERTRQALMNEVQKTVAAKQQAN